MKTIQSIMAAVAGRSRQILFATAALLLAVLATSVEATPFGDPTTNDWDCVMTGGGQDGIMFFHFTQDKDPITGLNTFEGVSVNAGNRNFPNMSRGGTGFGRTNTPTTVFTNLFGGGFINGPAGTVANNGGPNDWLAPDSTGFRGIWFWNPKGQVIGNFFFVVAVTPTFSLTNNVSFVGTVTPLKSLTLLASSSYGNIHFHGVPLVATTAPVFTNSAGATNYWVAQREQNGVTYGEIFTMFPTNVPNMFNLVGEGPSYTYTPGSFCLISSQKKIAFAIAQSAGTNVLASTGTRGSFSVTKNSMTANTTGLSTLTTSRIRFNAGAVENAP